MSFFVKYGKWYYVTFATLGNITESNLRASTQISADKDIHFILLMFIVVRIHFK